MHSASYSFVAAALLTLCLAQGHYLPKCFSCVSASRILSPAFGVDITASYATSAVRFHNGTVLKLSKVDASAFGREIRRLEKPTRQRDILQNPLGLWPRYNGPVTSRVVDAAAQVLVNLQTTTLTEFGLNLDPILLSILPLDDPSIGYDIMHKAAEISGIRLLLDRPGDMWPGAVAQAASANGIGLCPTFTKPDVCEQEELRLPTSRIFGVEYTNATLTVAVSPFQASRNGFSFNFRRHWHLGYDQVIRDSHYWHQVRQALAQLPKEWRHSPITDIIPMGEAAMDEEFLRVLQQTLWEVLPSKVEGTTAAAQPPLADWTADVEFAAAQGAAEEAKRVMEAPDGCIERFYCEWWRKIIG